MNSSGEITAWGVQSPQGSEHWGAVKGPVPVLTLKQRGRRTPERTSLAQGSCRLLALPLWTPSPLGFNGTGAQAEAALHSHTQGLIQL